MRELATMQERMNRISGPRMAATRGGNAARGAWAPVVDIYENPARELVIKADAPGLKREDIDLTFDSNVLTVRGERRPDEGIREEAYHRIERGSRPVLTLLHVAGARWMPGGCAPNTVTAC